MKRTGWIPASKNPVRPGWYEWRCRNGGVTNDAVVFVQWAGDDWVPPGWTLDRPRADCPGCQWRGLMKPAKVTR